MAKENQYTESQWTIQSISNNSALILNAETAYVIGATPETFTLKALKGGNVAEDASVCRSKVSRSLVVSVTVDNSTTRLQAAFDGGCVSLRYFRDNELLLEEDASILAGYSAPARKIATDRQVYEKAVHLRRLIDKIRSDSFFREQVLRSINQLVDPSTQDPIDYCDWVCKQCWHGMYFPHSCIACIYCNGFSAGDSGGEFD
ncbi:MAG TPA: hypothetical protein VKB05_13520 [Pyrinomonadaceae bacterium]|nr:hypothetical protein [Pyrinomonadaceae bacterium]